MKTDSELKIAKENIEKLKRIKSIILEDDLLDTISKNIHISECQEHKQTCKRWLKWLKDNYDYFDDLYCEREKEYIKKIQDLKQAIKLYEENGI